MHLIRETQRISLLMSSSGLHSNMSFLILSLPVHHIFLLIFCRSTWELQGSLALFAVCFHTTFPVAGFSHYYLNLQFIFLVTYNWHRMHTYTYIFIFIHIHTHKYVHDEVKKSEMKTLKVTLLIMRAFLFFNKENKIMHQKDISIS